MSPVENYTFSNEKRIIKSDHSTMRDSFPIKRVLSKKSGFYFWLMVSLTCASQGG